MSDVSDTSVGICCNKMLQLNILDLKLRKQQESGESRIKRLFIILIVLQMSLGLSNRRGKSGLEM
jgi:hypothetical protein